MLSGAMMFEFLGWTEAAQLIEDGIARTIQQKKVTYDLERLMRARPSWARRRSPARLLRT